MALALAACGGGGGGDVKDTAGDDDDTGGGGGGTTWRAGGEGSAYFLDGTVDNALFHLEMTRCPEPPEGEAYFGFVTRGGADPLPVGEITVVGEEVLFEGDIGTDAIIGGYDGFEAWVNASGTYGEGEQAWVGQVNTVVYDVIQNLVIASADTPSGEGSLRAVESLLEALAAEGQAAADETLDVDQVNVVGEALANAVTGAEEDYDENGTVEVFGDDLPILLDATGYVALIKADLADASGQVEPGDPIKDLADYAYDNIQAMETQAGYAATSFEVAAAVTTEDLGDEKLLDGVASVGYALTGYDLDEDGTVECRVENPTYTEGTIECALVYVSQMAQMVVTVP